MPLGMKLEMNRGPMQRQMRRFNASPRIMAAHLDSLVVRAMGAAKAEVKAGMIRYVYSAPLPEGADANYLQRRRRGALWSGITTKVLGGRHVATGEMRIPSSEVRGDNGYYYPRALNDQLGRMKQPRPFWTDAARMMRARFLNMGRTELRAIKGSFAGRTSGEVASLGMNANVGE